MTVDVIIPNHVEAAGYSALLIANNIAFDVRPIEGKAYRFVVQASIEIALYHYERLILNLIFESEAKSLNSMPAKETVQ